MQYYAHINGKDYAMQYGWTMTDEFSETLDSAIIDLPHVVGPISAKPYDDVIIHDYENGLPPHPIGEIFPDDGAHFYRHMLIYSIMKEKVSVDGIEEGGEREFVFNYHLELVSETKGLETVQLPNKTITQPKDIGKANERKYNDVSFAIGGSRLTLPYSLANKISDGTIAYQKHDAQLPFRWRKWYAFAGDLDESTSDFMNFTSVAQESLISEGFMLPDCNFSGATLAFGITDFWVDHFMDWSTYHPKKHWVIFKKDSGFSPFSSREKAVSVIEDYLSGTATTYDQFIVNEQVCGVRDITDDGAITVKYGSLAPSGTGDYEIYLYIEPQAAIAKDENGATVASFNVFGVTDNNNGITSPVQEVSEVPTDVTKPFLAVWETKCVSSLSSYDKSVLTVGEAVRQAIQLYSPYIKVTDSNGSVGTWRYVRKYSLYEETFNFFKNFIAPENQFDAPNLRDYITRLFYVADCIPVVKDGVITHMNIGERDPKPFSLDDENRSFEQYSMDGNSYCDRLLRFYNDGLSKDNVVSCVERIGFKNMDSATLTLENMRLELSHPIYRVTKVYMCYYKRLQDASSNQLMKLCKQDITPLVLLNAQRQLLSREWIDNWQSQPTDIKELASYYYATVGYDVGSNYITGWGTQYSHPTNLFWNAKRTTIENILSYVMRNTPNGVFEMDEPAHEYAETTEVFDSAASENRVARDPSSHDDFAIMGDDVISAASTYNDFFGQFTQRLKSLVFLVEYEGFISASVLASKEAHDGNVVSRDNASSSLSFVESDGINQREKANRLGNATRTVSARHKQYKDIQRLSQVWDDSATVSEDVPESASQPVSQDEMEHIDEVLYKRTITFNKDYFSVGYYLCRNYVLRNYFTSVFAKHRPFALASYQESIERKENKTVEMLISPDKWYWQNSSNQLKINKGEIGRILSFFVPSSYDSMGGLVPAKGVDSSFYGVYPSKTERYDGQFGFFGTDVQKFVSGNSICFSVPMKDNVSAGVFVGDFNKNLGEFIGATWNATWSLAVAQSNPVPWGTAQDAQNASILLTGAAQHWHMFPVDKNTGMLYSMSFSVGFETNDVYAIDSRKAYSDYNISLSMILPLMDCAVSGIIDDEKIYFGKYVNQKLVGAGYPKIAVKRHTVEISSQTIYSKYAVEFPTLVSPIIWGDAVVVSNNGSFAYPYGNADGNAIGSRQEITSLLTSVFRGNENESSEESEFCVFKDGKERIVTTMQIEAVSEDARVRLSPYAMKLSDAIGGKEKDYVSKDIQPVAKILFGVTDIRSTLIRETGVQDELRYDSAIFCAPTMTIGIPNAFLDVAQPFHYGETFTMTGPLRSYQMTVNDISIAVESSKYVLIVNCSISINGTAVLVNDDVRFVDITEMTDQDYVEGRTGNSDFNADLHCMKLGNGYRSFAFFEDAGFKTSSNSIIPFRASAYASGGASFYFSYSNMVAANSFCMMMTHTIQEGATPPDPYSFSDAPLSSANHVWTTMDGTAFLTPPNIYAYNPPSVNARSQDSVVDGPNLGISIIKTKNMYWTLCPKLLTIGSEYEKLNDLSKIGAVEYGNSFSPDTNIKLVTNENPIGMGRLVIDLPSEVSGPASLRLYYLEDGVYNFVFGVNVDKYKDEGEYKRPDCVYPTDSDAPTVYDLFVSLIDSRSRTVWSASDGEPSYAIKNYAEDYMAGETMPATGDNACIRK